MGHLIVGPKGCTYSELVKASGEKLSIPYEILDQKELKVQFPYFCLPGSFEGTLTRDRSGHISPRNLRRIHQQLAKDNGCQIVENIVI